MRRTVPDASPLLPIDCEIDAVVRRVFVPTAWALLGGAVVAALFVVLTTDPRIRPVLAVVIASFAAAVIGATWLARRARRNAAISLLLGTMVCIPLGYGLYTGLGVNAGLMALFPVVVLVASVLMGPWAAVGFAAASLAVVVGLYAAEINGVLAGSELLPLFPPVARMTSYSLAVVMALLFGLMLVRVTRTSVAKSRQQALRLQRLGSLAADWYWEQDEQFRFTHMSTTVDAATGISVGAHLGKTRWDLEELELTPEQWAAHRAQLEAHLPFRDFVMKRRGRAGRPVYVSISGEPVFDADGRFVGYWGVGREITAERERQRAIELSERRYHRLFEHNRVPLIVHRAGSVLQVNRAAAELLAFGPPAALVGKAFLELIAADSRPQTRERLAQIEAMPVDGALPWIGLRMLRGDGREISVQASAVRIELPDGVASLSQLYDTTEMERVEAERKRSVTMMAQVFDTSPDYITVRHLHTGAMVLSNAAFRTAFGYEGVDITGRNLSGNGLWLDIEERMRFQAMLTEQGTVRGFFARCATRDGRIRRVVISAAVFELDGEPLVVSTARDVTSDDETRLQAEAILANAMVGIAFTRDQKFRQLNEQMARMFGWPREELIGQSGAVVWPSEEAYAEVGREFGPRLGLGESVEFERHVRRRDGSTFLARLRASAIDPRSPVSAGTIWIVEDITAQRAAEQALAAAKNEAEAASRAKSAFLANTSHEIRTPLNGLQGLARLALDPQATPAQVREYLVGIQDSARQLTGILSDILDLSKIEAGRLSLEQTDFDLHALFDGVASAYRELADQHGLVLELAIDPATPRRVTGDPLRVRQIVTNYLANALKFTVSGGIWVDVRPASDSHLRIAVRDSGIGIDEATRQRLFEPFTQADESTTRRFGGTGLGLAICRELAQLMDGTVGVDSELDVGSTFWAELRLPPAPEAAPSAGAEAAPAASLAGMRALLVEDNPVNLMIAEAMLRSWGVEVATAENGRDAIAAVEARDGRFDVVLMDMHMPVMSGHDATRVLRARYGNAELPIVALTAAALVSEQQQCMALGMDGFVTKPIDERLLRRTLERFAPDRTSRAPSAG